jgi:hypothetical protein
LPELLLIEGIQQVAMKRGESLSASSFTFRLHFATIRRHYYCDFVTAREARLTWVHDTRLQRLCSLILTTNVSNKLGNLLFARS